MSTIAIGLRGPSHRSSGTAVTPESLAGCAEERRAVRMQKPRSVVELIIDGATASSCCVSSPVPNIYCGTMRSQCGRQRVRTDDGGLSLGEWIILELCHKESMNTIHSSTIA